MIRIILRAGVAALAAAFVVLPVAESAMAILKRVTAYSRYGNGSVTGAVRINHQGYPEVQMPSGTWIDCAGDCREALRRMHLDFWDTLQEESGGGDRR